MLDKITSMPVWSQNPFITQYRDLLILFLIPLYIFGVQKCLTLLSNGLEPTEFDITDFCVERIMSRHFLAYNPLKAPLCFEAKAYNPASMIKQQFPD